MNPDNSDTFTGRTHLGINQSSITRPGPCFTETAQNIRILCTIEYLRRKEHWLHNGSKRWVEALLMTTFQPTQRFGHPERHVLILQQNKCTMKVASNNSFVRFESTPHRVLPYECKCNSKDVQLHPVATMCSNQ